MARRKLTPEEMAAKVAKMKATKAANKKAALESLGVEAPKKKKIRRHRKPMTDEQKEAARLRLEKARAARAPSTNKYIHEEVRNLPDDDPFSLAKVREWIKENKALLSSIRNYQFSKVESERRMYRNTKIYVTNLEAYLRDGVYRDNRFGAMGEGKIVYQVLSMAYDKDGNPKRTVGWYYSDIGIYTQKMADDDARRKAVPDEN